MLMRVARLQSWQAICPRLPESGTTLGPQARNASWAWATGLRWRSPRQPKKQGCQALANGEVMLLCEGSSELLVARLGEQSWTSARHSTTTTATKQLARNEVVWRALCPATPARAHPSPQQPLARRRPAPVEADGRSPSRRRQGQACQRLCSGGTHICAHVRERTHICAPGTHTHVHSFENKQELSWNAHTRQTNANTHTYMHTRNTNMCSWHTHTCAHLEPYMCVSGEKIFVHLQHTVMSTCSPGTHTYAHLEHVQHWSRPGAHQHV